MTETAWKDRAKASLDDLVAEAGDEHRDNLVVCPVFS